MDETFEVVIGNQRIVAYSDVRGDQLAPGDMYIAKRNTGWHLAKCLYVNHDAGWVMPDPPASIYSYDCHECAKVKSITDVHEEDIMPEVNRMWDAYTRYKDTAEQHEFTKLLICDMRLAPFYRDLQVNFAAEHAYLFRAGMLKVLDMFGITEW